MKKQLLSIEQVNKNLKAFFPDVESFCFHAVNGLYVMDFPGHGRVMVDEFKKVYIQWPGQDKQKEYEQYCKDNAAVPYIRKRAVCSEFIPLIWNRKTANAKLIMQHEQFLQACGYGKRQKVQSEESRLKELAGPNYLAFYKLIKEVNVKQSFLAMGKLHVIHETGKFSFPVRNISHPANQLQDQEVRNIFFNLLGLPVSSKQLTAA